MPRENYALLGSFPVYIAIGVHISTKSLRKCHCSFLFIVSLSDPDSSWRSKVLTPSTAVQRELSLTEMQASQVLELQLEYLYCAILQFQLALAKGECEGGKKRSLCVVQDANERVPDG